MRIKIPMFKAAFGVVLTQRNKFILNALGSIVAILGVYFVVSRLQNYSSQVTFTSLNRTSITELLFITIFYGFSSLLLGCIWKNILEFCGEQKCYLWAIKIYGMSQLAKYIPGNIFHFAGRQAIGMASNAKAKPLAKSTFYELVLLVCSGSLFSIIALPLIISSVPLYSSLLTFIAIVVTICFFMIKKSQYFLAKAFSIQIVFLCISGLSFVGVISIVIPKLSMGFPEILLIASAFVTAWLIGLVTPGAPAGLGVREVVIIFFLHSLINESDLLFAVVISRIVTVSGDLIFFLISSLVYKKHLRA